MSKRTISFISLLGLFLSIQQQIFTQTPQDSLPKKQEPRLFNTFYGEGVGSSNIDGHGNSIFGCWAVFANTEGFENSFFGMYAGFSNTEGTNNSFFGERAGASNTKGTDNCLFGKFSGSNNMKGNHNSFFGRSAGVSNTSGDGNCFMGIFSGGANMDGSFNTFIGTYVASRNLNGNRNTFIGNESGKHNISGSNNTFIGTETGHLASSNQSNYSTAIGVKSKVTASYQIRLGNEDTQSIGGFNDWTKLSDVRFQSQIKENVVGLDFIKKLRPVTYQINKDKLTNFLYQDNLTNSETETIPSYQANQIIYSGFVTQEVAAAQEAGYQFSGVESPQNEKDLSGIRQVELVVPLVKAIQEQQKIIEQLEARVEELEKDR